MTPCISPLWTKTGVLQKLPANGLHISLVTHVSPPAPYNSFLGLIVDTILQVWS